MEVMERTELLMMKAVVRYREDQDLENAIDFIQKKVSVSTWWRSAVVQMITVR